MTDYVLVHGAWAGGWSHEGLAQDLRALGHRAVVVHLKGLGIRRDEAHPGITLTDHIDDVCAAVDEAGLDRFVLVGHSYGGMVITGAADRLLARHRAALRRLGLVAHAAGGVTLPDAAYRWRHPAVASHL